MPLFVSTVVTVRFRSKLSQETVYIFFFSAFSIVLLNSLFNPIIYATRMRQFRLMFIELSCRIVNIAEAEEIEMRVFRVSSALGRLKPRLHERFFACDGDAIFFENCRVTSARRKSHV